MPPKPRQQRETGQNGLTRVHVWVLDNLLLGGRALGHVKLSRVLGVGRPGETMFKAAHRGRRRETEKAIKLGERDSK